MLTLITPPDWASDPLITSDDLQEHLRRDEQSTIEDAYCLAATDYVQSFTRRAIGRQTWELHLDHFPSSPITLPLPPLEAVDSIKYTDPDGNTQTWDSYVVANGRIFPEYGESYPATRAVPNAVAVRFTCGYTSEELPASIRAALLLLVGDLYENREAQQAVTLHQNKTVERLLWPYRVF